MVSPSNEIIQLTNDDATSSKAYAVSRGYWKDKYIKYFCSSPSHKTPEINRGYFIRTAAFRAIAISFIKSTGGACQVVSLGAGSDTLYFSLKDTQQTPELYVEIDLALNIRQKAMIIQRRKLLETTAAVPSNDDYLQPTTSRKSINADGLHNDLHYVFEAGRFHLISFDLRRPVHELIDILCSTVRGPGCSKIYPTLFLAECVLVYMPAETSYKLIEGLSANFPRASFLHYEQAVYSTTLCHVNMNDSFGSIMIKNFRARSCELPGLDACHSLATQEERFLKAGWKISKGWTINQVYKTLPANTRYRIEHLELLDDIEVTVQLFDHYCILLATNDETVCPMKQLEESLCSVE
ncbi:Leucine carboxyl methyltransferase 1 [Schistosoma japonicum]|nr:Leucine carboxyl methyltransferase 1 [Schistosoma japonicum]